jgi:DNA invertase Pin-like site-specific DNA recombinase
MGMASLIKDSKENKFDVIIFYSLDRPFVSLRHLCNTFRYWQSLGKSFVSIMDGIDTTSSMQTKNLSHLLMVLANFEGRVFGDRTKAGNIGRKARGAIDLKRTINRKQVIKQYKAGMVQAHIAKIHNCAASAICKIVREYRELELKKKGMVLQ